MKIVSIANELVEEKQPVEQTMSEEQQKRMAFISLNQRGWKKKEIN